MKLFDESPVATSPIPQGRPLGVGTERPAHGSGAPRGSWVPLFAVLAVYLVVRLVAWQRVVLVEDHDSMSYLRYMRAMLSLDPQRILGLEPDASPFYPLLGALLSAPGIPLETSARLASFLLAVGLFIALWGIGRRFAAPGAVILGLFILALNPPYVALSYSVLSEPTYIGLVYLGLWLFWSQREAPGAFTGAWLGVVFGLTFLTRTEGLLYLGIVPALQGVSDLATRPRRYGPARFVRWAAAYGVVFLLVAAPQIWWVSREMGALAVNGRQAWALLMSYPDGKSYEEKIYGLDFSPTETNVQAAHRHPEVRERLATGFEPVRQAKIALRNFDRLNRDTLGELLGPLAIALAGLGLFTLFRTGRAAEALLAAAFVAFNLAAPLAYNEYNFFLRHIAIVGPVLMLVAGVGAWALVGGVGHGFRRVGPWLIVAAILGTWLVPLRDLLDPPRWTDEYDPAALEEPARLIRSIAAAELDREPVVMSRKNFLPHHAGAVHVFLPFTDYDGLVRYAAANRVDFVFLDARRIQGHPFRPAFEGASPPVGFELVHRGAGRSGQQLDLYRFRAPTGSGSGPEARGVSP